MEKLLTKFIGVCVALGAVIAPSIILAADTHVIVGTQQVTWTYGGKKSTPSSPLVVDDLKVGDIVEIQIPQGPIPHGFVTIANGAESRDLVLACGDSKTSKPNAVLQEIKCGPASKFGVRMTGSMQLQVLNTFQSETDFWCIVHHQAMAGVLKLKQ
jgi:hypothetical protein